MKTSARFMSMVLGLVCLGNCAACSGKTEQKQAPDYSGYKHQFEFYAYNPPNDGKWLERDGTEMSSGEDFRTVEQYRIYKEAGFSILLLQQSGVFYGDEEWETSNTKSLMDKAVAAGIDKVIVTDKRIQGLSAVEGGLIGPDKRFADEAALDAYVRECVKDYSAHEAFYGVQLYDEPYYKLVEAYGQTYRAVKRVLPACYVQIQLNHFFTHEANVDAAYPPVEGEFANPTEKAAARYRAYFEAFIDATGTDYLMYDHYPLQKQIHEDYIRSLQIAAEVCKAKGIKLAVTTQTMSMYSNGVLRERKISEKDALWLNNMLLGFGVKQIVYFTYFNKGWNGSTAYNPDNTSFINHYGEKTEIYAFMQKIMAEIQKFAPVILNFDYVTSAVYTKPPLSYPGGYVAKVTNGAFTEAVEFKTDKECALVSELYDEENGRYMYMVQNIIDPIYKGSKAYQTSTIRFGDEYTEALVFSRGVQTRVKLKDHAYTVSQHPGEAVFVLPF